MAHRLPLADIRFISDFAAFARSKGDEEYDFGSNDNCACAQFLRDTGRANDPNVGPFFWLDGASKTDMVPGVNDALNPIIGKWTFSALADRLEALIADAPVVERGR